MNPVTRVVSEGAASLSRAATHLEEIDRTSERAVREMKQLVT